MKEQDGVVGKHRQDKAEEIRFFGGQKEHESFDRLPQALKDPTIATVDLVDKYCQPGAHVLEVGCGFGDVGRLLLARTKKNLHITGVDIAPSRIEWLRRLQHKNYAAIAGDLEDELLFGPGSFDSVLSNGVLHHFPSLQDSPVVANIAKWLKPNGCAVLFEPNGSNPTVRWPNLIGKLLLLLKHDAHATTRNEVTHSYSTYYKTFARNGMDEVHREAWKYPGIPTLPGMSVMTSIYAYTRWILFKAVQPLPFPWGGEALILVYKKRG